MKKQSIAIIGGAGHVGAPLGIALANRGYKTTLIDLNKKNNQIINSGKMPFLEDGCEKILRKNLSKNMIFATNDYAEIKKNKIIIIAIGTNIKSNFKPELKKFLNFFHFLKKKINRKQSIVIRSSIYPGAYDKVYSIIKTKCKNLTYCPERIAQGKSILELPKIAQIISGKNVKEIKKISKIFNQISRKVIVTDVLEAELIKLFSNTYRYINFSIANQFYTMCNGLGLDYEKLRLLMKDSYSRNNNIPKAGFTRGPCLLKDTMQLSSFFNNKFKLLNEARNINEGIPKVIFKNLKLKYKLKTKTIGILGLTFKADNDDIRDSLSLKLLNLFKKNNIKVLASDEYYKKAGLLDKKELVNKSDIIIIATGHKEYKKIKISKNKIVIDIWNILKD
tara:strand:- start:105 stop:1280 length:1176 start_codon:yes stop_codon:yes gene_type:complete